MRLAGVVFVIVSSSAAEPAEGQRSAHHPQHQEKGPSSLSVLSLAIGIAIHHTQNSKRTPAGPKILGVAPAAVYSLATP